MAPASPKTDNPLEHNTLQRKERPIGRYTYWLLCDVRQGGGGKCDNKDSYCRVHTNVANAPKRGGVGGGLRQYIYPALPIPGSVWPLTLFNC